jgi:hypothetical protein
MPFVHSLSVPVPVTSLASLLSHHTEPIFSGLLELVFGDLTVTIAVHAIKDRTTTLALRNNTVTISIHVIETSQCLFGALSRDITDFLTGYFAIAIRIHAHLWRITTLRHSKLIKANRAIVIGIHLLYGLTHPLAAFTMVTVPICESRHCNHAHRQNKY